MWFVQEILKLRLIWDASKKRSLKDKDKDFALLLPYARSISSCMLCNIKLFHNLKLLFLGPVQTLPMFISLFRVLCQIYTTVWVAVRISEAPIWRYSSRIHFFLVTFRTLRLQKWVVLLVLFSICHEFITCSNSNLTSSVFPQDALVLFPRPWACTVGYI